MSLMSGAITRAGALIDVLVSVGPRRRQILARNGLRAPDPVAVRAVLDTGANLSGFARRVFVALELPPVGVIQIATPSTTPDAPFECELFDETLSVIADGHPVPVLHSHVIATDGWHPDSEEGVEGLIGRDVLNRATFQYFGIDRHFTLAFADAGDAEP